MNTIISFLLGCIILAACVTIGGVVLNLLFGLGIMLIAGIVSGIGWIWQKLTGGD